MTEIGIFVGLCLLMIFSVAAFIIRERRSDKEFAERLKRGKNENRY